MVPVNSQSKEKTGKRGEIVKVKQEDNRERLGIGTWNVRSLNMMGKLKEAKRVMERYRLGILGLGETHWKGQKHFVSDGMRIIL